MAYKMKGSPAKLGTIQGTSGHSSALKQKEESLKSKKKRADKLDKEKAIRERLEKHEGQPEQIAKAEADKIKEGIKVQAENEKKAVEDEKANIIKGEEKHAAEQKTIGDAKTESRFDVMDALKGYLSSGNLRGAIGAGFSKKSPNEILAMQKARETRNKRDNVIETDYQYGMSPKEDQLKEADNTGTAGPDTTAGVETVGGKLATKKGGTK